MISIIYKAHFFVANAFLLMIYPCIFFRGVRMSWRIVSAGTLTGLFLLVVSLSQHLKGIPTLRLDGSGVIPYVRFLIHASDPGVFKSFFQVAFPPLWQSKTHHLLLNLWLPGYLVLFTFGLWALGLFLLLLLGKRRIGAAAFFFPFLVVINYLVMSLGLAADANGIGRPEELLHRPFVWTYFVVVAWTGAGAYAYLIGDQPPRSRSARIFAALVVLASFSVPLVYARNILTFPAFGKASYTMFNSIPSGLVKACFYIREHSETKDIIQDYENDPHWWVITALAERQAFVAYDPERTASFGDTRLPEGLRGRLSELAACKEMTDEASVTEFMQKHRISWYILDPDSQVAWPTSFLEKAVFQSSGYRVFHFSS
jgi:hypothetical protein